MKEDMAEWYDTCDYPTTHPCYSKQNAKRLGFFKDETNGIPILEFIGLESQNVFDTSWRWQHKDDREGD